MGLKYDVISPFVGTIERILFRSGDRVQEGESLFTLVDGRKSIDIFSPVTGYVDAVEVEKGDHVIEGMILASIVLSNDETNTIEGQAVLS
ncbi:biotin/lipoyl-containing protein [Brevibacillus sp. NRS-1366]|uniref:biotin/lipoyl-containing protein n=1 Tax=Brevibacillus sp. NRS-1366 TaxID=3233899 RepID=UPI003D1FC7BD